MTRYHRVAREDHDRSSPNRGEFAPPDLAVGGDRSRCGGSSSEGLQVAPLVGFTEGVFIVGGITRIDLGCAVTGEKSLERLVYEGGIGGAGSKAPGTLQQFGIHGRAQACARHATIVPRCLCQAWSTVGRLRTTPVPAWQLLAAIVVLVFGVTVVMAFPSVAVPALLGLPLPANLPAFALTAALGGCSFLAIGALLCGVARNSRVGSGIGGFVAFLMWFAAGMWIPRAIFPPALQIASDLTPGGAAASGMLQAMAGEWPQPMGLAVLGGWALVGFMVAARTFRLEARAARCWGRAGCPGLSR